MPTSRHHRSTTPSLWAARGSSDASLSGRCSKEKTWTLLRTERKLVQSMSRAKKTRHQAQLSRLAFAFNLIFLYSVASRLDLCS
jgi:hypothetical protein